MTDKHTRMTFGQTGPSRRDVLRSGTALGVGAGLLGLPTLARAAPKQGGKLRIAMGEGSTSDSLDPQTYADAFMMSVGFGTHGTLTEIAPDGELVGDLAESWEASADVKTWTFKVRQGVAFSNGKTLDADDVIASINHHRGEQSQSAAKSNVEPIADMKKIDAATIAFELTAGNADFPYLMADYHLLIMPAVDGKPDWENYIGTGGYVLEAFEPGIRAVLKRNPNYWKDGRAHLDEIEMIVIADPAARTNSMITGEVDCLQRVDLKTIDLLKRVPGVDVEEATGFLHYTAPMITTSSPYDNNELRLAIKHGIDREELLTKVLRGHGVVGNDHPIAPSVPFWADLEQRVYDPDKAKFHLKKSGYEGVPLTLSAADGAYAGAVDAAQIMQQQLGKAGIQIDVAREPNDGYWSNVWMKKDWCQCYWGGRPTCDWMFSQAYASGANWNDTFWEHERFNKLLGQGRAELDPSVRAEIYRDAQQIVRDDGGVVVWAFANYVNAKRDTIQHEENVAANWDLDGGRFMERWWMA